MAVRGRIWCCVSVDSIFWSSNAGVSRRWPVDVKARGQGLGAERIPISQVSGSEDSLVCDTVESEPDSVVGLGTARWDGLAAACRH